VARLNALTDRARNGIEGAIRATGAPASVTGAGSMFLVHMKQTPPRNYRDAYPNPDESRRLKALLEHLYNEGCIIISSGTCVFSTPMTEAEIDTLVGAYKSGFAKLASMG
jgi:glutamate-1-semialdehyde 2,1-aminomutase